MSPDGATWNFKYDRDGFRTEREYSYSGEVIVKNEYTWVDGMAAFRVSQGGDIICANQAGALYILYLNGYRKAVGPEICRCDSALPHYHPIRGPLSKARRQIEKSTHIWFYQ